MRSLSVALISFLYDALRAAVYLNVFLPLNGLPCTFLFPAATAPARGHARRSRSPFPIIKLRAGRRNVRKKSVAAFLPFQGGVGRVARFHANITTPESVYIPTDTKGHKANEEMTGGAYCRIDDTEPGGLRARFWE